MCFAPSDEGTAAAPNGREKSGTADAAKTRLTDAGSCDATPWNAKRASSPRTETRTDAIRQTTSARGIGRRADQFNHLFSASGAISAVRHGKEGTATLVGASSGVAHDRLHCTLHVANTNRGWEPIRQWGFSLAHFSCDVSGTPLTCRSTCTMGETPMLRQWSDLRIVFLPELFNTKYLF